jgi:hypothetical protein
VVIVRCADTVPGHVVYTPILPPPRLMSAPRVWTLSALLETWFCTAPVMWGLAREEHGG